MAMPKSIIGRFFGIIRPSLAGKPQLTTELVQLFLHQNQFGMQVVPDPFPPRAGDVIHPVLRLVRGRLTSSD